MKKFPKLLLISLLLFIFATSLAFAQRTWTSNVAGVTLVRPARSSGNFVVVARALPMKEGVPQYKPFAFMGKTYYPLINLDLHEIPADKVPPANPLKVKRALQAAVVIKIPHAFVNEKTGQMASQGNIYAYYMGKVYAIGDLVDPMGKTGVWEYKQNMYDRETRQAVFMAKVSAWPLDDLMIGFGK